tara:strand:- start:391 stop:597 length:207 start_codon:yes stop_codon:yes gene_type:complete
MKIYIAKDLDNEIPYGFTSKRRMLKEANANDWVVEEPIVFNLTKVGVIRAMETLSHHCNNSIDITIGN